MNEPTITINGQQLTEGQAMTIRVALETFAIDISSHGLGEDAHGQIMRENYARIIGEIRALIAKK